MGPDRLDTSVKERTARPLLPTARSAVVERGRGARSWREETLQLSGARWGRLPGDGRRQERHSRGLCRASRGLCRSPGRGSLRRGWVSVHGERRVPAGYMSPGPTGPSRMRPAQTRPALTSQPGRTGCGGLHQSLEDSRNAKGQPLRGCPSPLLFLPGWSEPGAPCENQTPRVRTGIIDLTSLWGDLRRACGPESSSERIPREERSVPTGERYRCQESGCRCRRYRRARDHHRTSA